MRQAGIAGELVAHFADGLEDGTAEEELLAGFGDPRATAKLMRRAKLRCRPWPLRGMLAKVQAIAVSKLAPATRSPSPRALTSKELRRWLRCSSIGGDMAAGP